MLRIALIILFLIRFMSESPAQRLSPHIYWVQLKDKEHTEYSIESPGQFLSERAILRRLKSGIPVTVQDLPVSGFYIDSLRETGVEIIGTSKWFNSVIIRTTDTLALDEIASLDFVKDFSTDYENFSSANVESCKNEIKIPSALPGSAYYGVTSSQISLLSGNFLHNFGYRGEGMIIAVLDAGFYKVDEIKAFDHLWENNHIIDFKDFVEPSSEPFTHSTHGLAVLSTLAAYIPDTFVGTAPESSYLLLRSEEAARENKVEEAYWILAAEYADSAGADIISSSLGYHDFPTSDKMDYSYEDLTGDRALVTRAAETAFSRGMIVVASAGNEGTNEWRKITPPADGPNVLAVGSVDTTAMVTNFSSRGNTTDGRIKPDVMAVGFRTKIIDPGGEPADGFGTSFAAPQVAGLVACLWQAVPEKTNREIISAIRETSSQFDNPDSIKGYGIPNFIYALWNLKKDSINSPAPGLVVYPNPSEGIFELQQTGPEIGILQIDIFSSDGKLVHSRKEDWKPGEKIRINGLKNQVPGVYYIIAQSTGGEIVTKLVKQ